MHGQHAPRAGNCLSVLDPYFGAYFRILDVLIYNLSMWLLRALFYLLIDFPYSKNKTISAG
jgi:hypothetical protein